MIWKHKVDRIYDHRAKQKKEAIPSDGSEIRLDQETERGDLFSMIVSALIVIMPVAIIVLIGLPLLTWLLMGLWR